MEKLPAKARTGYSEVWTSVSIQLHLAESKVIPDTLTITHVLQQLRQSSLQVGSPIYNARNLYIVHLVAV